MVYVLAYWVLLRFFMSRPKPAVIPLGHPKWSKVADCVIFYPANLLVRLSDAIVLPGASMRLTTGSPVLVAALSITVLILLSISCSTKAEMTIRKDRGASISLLVSIPPEIEAWMRRTSGMPAGSQLFDPANTAAALRNRGLKVLGYSIPDRSSQAINFEAMDLAAFIAGDPGLRDSGLLRYESGQGWASLRMTVSSTNASALIDLFPGVDPDLLEALQPPALFYNPVSTAEYRSMLGVLMGRTAATALDATTLSLNLVLPGAITESSGLTLAPGPSPRSASLSIAVVEAMVLEKPIHLYLKWQQ